MHASPTLLGPRQPPTRPPPASAAAALDGHDQGRQGSPSRCSCWAGEAGRRLDQEQTEAIAAVLAWLAAHPPTPPAAAGSAAAAGMPVEQRPATRTGTRLARPHPAWAAGRSTQRGTGGSGGGPTPKSDASGQPGGRGGLEGGGSWWTDPRSVRVQAVGLVGAGWPVGEVARVLGVHPAALRRWVWQAWQEWGTAMGLTQPDSLTLSCDRDEGQQGAG